MALKHKTSGKYLRVNKEQMLSALTLQIFESQTHRNTGDTEFLTHKQDFENIGTKLLQALGTTTVNLIAEKAYLILKDISSEDIAGDITGQKKYKDWEDC